MTRQDIEAGLDPNLAVDAILGLWGVTQGDATDLNMNIKLALAAAELGLSLGAKTVIHVSSVGVYDFSDGQARKETDAIGGAGLYGQSKADMERVIAHWQTNHPDKLGQICLRLANVVGADSLSANISKGGSITLDQFADGSAPQRSYIAPSDLARVVERLLTVSPSKLPPVLNVAAPGVIGMDEIALAANADMVRQPAGPNAIRRAEVDVSKLQSLIEPMAFRSSADEMVGDWMIWRRKP